MCDFYAIWVLNQRARRAALSSVSSTIYLHCRRFAYLQLMKQGFNFLLLEINIILLEQRGGSKMRSMKKKQDKGDGSDTE